MTHLKQFASLLAAVFALALAGCTSLPPVPPPGSAVQQCAVCRHRRDFDCLVVAKSPKTPQLVYRERTYYFCSEGCRDEFRSHPEVYRW